MKVEIYTRPKCPYCIKAKEEFDFIGVDYIEYELSSTITKRLIESRLNDSNDPHTITTIPQIFINDKYIGGYSELMSSQILATISKGEIK